MWTFDRITIDPSEMGGVPCVRHLRIPVATVLRLPAGGVTGSEILSEYPDLQPEDIRECPRYAALSMLERELPLPTPLEIPDRQCAPTAVGDIAHIGRKCSHGTRIFAAGTAPDVP